MTGESITSIAYGTFKTDTMDFVSIGEELTKVLHKTLSGYLVEFFPARK